MKHVFWLLTDQLAGRAGPTREPWNVGDFSAAGFDSILSLDEQEIDPAAMSAAGLSHKLIRFPNYYPPDAPLVKEFRDKLLIAHQFVCQQMTNGNRLLIHCVAGCDRTGIVMAYYLCATLGLSPEEGIARVRAVRPNAILAPGWEEMILPIMTEFLENEKNV
jgi:protein-tyrosine phosphatase